MRTTPRRQRIDSQGRYRPAVKGEAGHAGTVPMNLRKDALAAAAEVITRVEAVARRGAADAVVGTVGEVRVHPGASNVIPGAVALSLDLRAANDAARVRAAGEIKEGVVVTCLRGVGFHGCRPEKPVAVCAPRLRRALSRAIADHGQDTPRELMSGAGLTATR